jgi:photosystem II stability/assembly factor-like uncharacterized protein
VAPGAGWVLLDQRLHWTEAAGQDWRDLTPPAVGADAILAVTFTDTQHGWLVTSSDAPDPAYRLFRTANGGNNWDEAALALFAPGEVSALASGVFLEFIDSDTGWLVVKQATSSAFNVGTLFRTTDGGATWTRSAIPAGVPVHFSSPLEGWLDTGPPENAHYTTRDGGQTWTPDTQSPLADPASNGLSDFSFATTEAGWARSAVGACEGAGCELVIQLMQTSDGGQTWTPVSLPNGQTKLTKTFTVPASGAAADAADSHNGLAFNYNGHGFDSCTLPSSSTMQTWYNASPYKVWNLYLGGAAVANCGNLTASYLNTLTQQGWLFIPTWVGPQPPCSNVGRSKFSADLATAYQQGVIEAHLAMDRAQVLGLLRPGQAGTLIYYDVESYPNQSACRDATKSFISGWTATLRARGSRSGVYGSPCSSYLPDLAGIANVPDAVWLAVWKLPAQYDQFASVMSVSCISNSLWNQGQRLRQYAGDHSENWGGVSLNIDSNVIAGPIATTGGGCAPGNGQVALFIHTNFGGQCVVRALGDYGSVGALGLPNDSISSLTLGPNVKLQLCEHENFQGVCQEFSGPDGDLTGDRIGNDNASSLKVLAHTRPALTHHYRFPLMGRAGSLAVGLPNGGLESGPAGWSTFSARGNNVIVPGNVLAAAAVSPHSGSWGIWLGGVHTETVTLEQTVGLPAEAPNLTYWHWIKSSETGCHYDVVSIWVNNSVVESYGLCAGANTNGWSKQKLDLSTYAGHTVHLRVQLTTDSSILSSVFVDDLVFESGQ